MRMSADGPQATILGAGSWGTALASHLGGSGRSVRLWGRDPSLMQEIAAQGRNPTYVPHASLPASVRATGSLDEALAGAGYVIVAVPSHGLRAVLRAAAPMIPRGAVLVSATKGIEETSLQRMSEILAEETRGEHAVAVLSGPSFAAEVARKLPTALVVASTDASARRSVQDEFRGPFLRLYESDDVVGVEIGGALKNTIAIAAGVVESLALGHNAVAALVTRGLAEMSRLAAALGARRETLSGLSGLGDLMLTCTGELSRNRQVGLELGRGRPIADIVSGMRMVAEGVRTTEAALALAARAGVELPIAQQMADVMAGRRSPRQAVDCLMLRPQRGELDLD